MNLKNKVRAIWFAFRANCGALRYWLGWLLAEGAVVLRATARNVAGRLRAAPAWVKSDRFWLVWVTSAAVVAWYAMTGPSGGAETAARLERLAWFVVLIPFVYWGRRVLVRGRSEDAASEAMKGPTGAGLLVLAYAVLSGFLFLALSAQAAEPLPPRAVQYLPVLQSEAQQLWPDLGMPSVLAAQIEQETCPSAGSRSCWNPAVEIRNAREYAFGFQQTTVAYRADGSVRFNRWQEDRDKHAAELSDWTWAKRLDARMQLRAQVLGNRDCYRRMTRLGPDSYNALAMCDSAHNGGEGSVLADRRLCARIAGCDPNKWFGNVEAHSLKSSTPHAIYGGQSLRGINRAHVRNVMLIRRPKYVAWFREGA